MMLILNFILLSLCFWKVFLQESSGWKIKIENKDLIKTMTIGIFHEINVHFSNINQLPTSFPMVEFKLSNNNGLIKTSADSYHIDLSKEHIVKVLIGASCKTPIDSETIISFKNIAPDSDFISIEYPIKLIAGTPEVIDIKTTSDTLAIGEYGKAYLGHKIPNVDRIMIELSTSNTDMDIPIWIIESYNPIISSNYINVDYALKISSTVPAQTKIIVNIAYKEENTCFTINTKSFELLINSGSIESTKKKYVNFRYHLADLNQVEIMPENQIFPSILHCVAIATSKEFPTIQQILSPDIIKDNNPTTYYFQFFNHIKIRMPTIHLTGLDKYQMYKMKCVYENTAIASSSLKTSSIFISNKPITINKSTEELSSCATWFIKKPYDKAAFEDKVIAYCNNPILLLSVPRSESGCLTCYKREVPSTLFHLDDNTEASSICMSSEPTCTSKADNFELKNYFNELTEAFNTKEKIKETLGINIMLKGSILQETDSSSSKEKFNIINTKHDSKNFDISFNHKEGLPQDCTIKLICDSIPEISLKSETFLLNQGDNKQLSFSFALDDYDDFIYSLIINCRAMPFFPYHSYISEFVSETFVHNITIDCKLNPYLPECNYYEPSEVPIFQSFNPIEILHDDFISFIFEMDFDNKQNFFLSKLPLFAESKVDMEVLNYTTLFGQFMQVWNCSEKYFHACRLIKKLVTEKVFLQLKDHFPEGSIVEELLKKDDVLKSTLEVRSKMLILTMALAASNIDAYDSKTGQILIDYMISYMKESKQLIKEIKNDLKINQQKNNDTYIKVVGNDIGKILSYTMDYMISYIDYAEKEGYIPSDDIHHLISFNPPLLELKECMKILISIIIENSFDNSEITGNNYNITFKTLSDNPGDHDGHTEFKDDKVAITLPGVFLKSKGVKHIAIISYIKHPLFSFKSSDSYAKEIVQIVLLNEQFDVITLNENLPKESKLTISFYLKSFNDAFAYCYYYKDYKLNVDGVLTDQSNHKLTTCTYDTLDNDILIGLYNLFGKQKFFIDMWIIVLSIIILCIIITSFTYLIVFVWKKKTNVENLIEANQINVVEPLFDEDSHNDIITDEEKIAQRTQMNITEDLSCVL